MHRILYILLFISSHTFAQKNIILGIGHTHLLKVNGTEKIYLANSSLLQIRDKTHHLKLTGKKLGTTELHIGKTKYQIYILPKPIYFQYLNLSQTMLTIMGLKLKISNQCLTITGELLRVSDYWKIQSLVNDRSNKFCKKNLSWSIKVNSKIFLNFKNELLRRYYFLENSNCKIRNREIISFICPTNMKTDISDNKVGIPILFDKNLKGSQKQIKLELNIFEMDSLELENLGISQPERLKFQKKDFKILTLDSIDLHLLDRKGKAKILSQPSIISNYNEDIKYQNGGELPLQLINDKQQKVVWKEYGLIFRAKVIKQDAKNVFIDFELELSAPDYSSAINGVPGFFKNITKHKINIPINTSILISGLNKKQWRNNLKALHSFSQLPVIGIFFKNSSEQKNNSQLNISISISELKWKN